RVMSLHQDRHGTLWIGTFASSLRRLSRDGRLQSFGVKPGDEHSLSAAGIMSLFEARDGAIWVGTHGGGANLVDPASGRVRQLPYGSAAPGAVSSPHVTAIAEDAHGDLWLGTEGGGLDLARADGTVVKVFRHDPRDPASLPANTVYALAVDANDRVWVATDGGGLALVQGSVAAPDAIRFKVLYRANILSLDFGALDFASPKRNRLAYRMTGLTDRWLDLGTQRRITLTNIESGDHLLEVRAANSDSVWSGTPLKLTIHRDPPPWKSWWACIGYALAVLGVIAYRVRLQRLKFQQVLDTRQRLESEVKLRTRELTESNRQLAQAVRAKSASGRKCVPPPPPTARAWRSR